MRLATTTLLALLLVGGIGTAFGQSSQLDVRTKTTPGDVLTNPASPATHDPGVNPSAAGSQREWRGYGASSEAARHGSSNTAQYNRTDKRPLKPRDLNRTPAASADPDGRRRADHGTV
jgi:hypothetical protein